MIKAEGKKENTENGERITKSGNGEEADGLNGIHLLNTIDSPLRQVTERRVGQGAVYPVCLEAERVAI